VKLRKTSDIEHPTPNKEQGAMRLLRSSQRSSHANQIPESGECQVSAAFHARRHARDHAEYLFTVLPASCRQNESMRDRKTCRRDAGGTLERHHEAPLTDTMRKHHLGQHTPSHVPTCRLSNW